MTLGSLFCGWYSIVNSLRGFLEGTDSARAATLFSGAAWAIGLAIVLDNLDGRIARTIGAESAFGVELDSLSDVLTFGVAAAVLAYTSGYGRVPGLETPAFLISFVFVAAGAIRLARSNVRAHSIQADSSSPAREEKYFVGLPIPAAASVVAAVTYFYYSPVAKRAAAAVQPHGLPLMAAVLLLALLMVSPFPYSKLKIASRGRKPLSVLNRAVFPAIAVAVVIGMWLGSRWVVLAIAVLYAVHGPILQTVRSLARPPA
jgi:CDP-diacylglycerol--serine O-phosphatidyltransferase